jgi:hypothetical protein
MSFVRAGVAVALVGQLALGVPPLAARSPATVSQDQRPPQSFRVTGGPVTLLGFVDGRSQLVVATLSSLYLWDTDEPATPSIAETRVSGDKAVYGLTLDAAFVTTTSIAISTDGRRVARRRSATWPASSVTGRFASRELTRGGMPSLASSGCHGRPSNQW